MTLTAASYAARAAASALPLWLIVAALAASRAAPSASARPSVTRPTEMMNEITQQQGRRQHRQLQRERAAVATPAGLPGHAQSSPERLNTSNGPPAVAVIVSLSPPKRPGISRIGLAEP